MKIRYQVLCDCAPRVCVVLAISTLSSVSDAAPRKGYRHDATGALLDVRDVTSDVANCGFIGRTCQGGQTCCDGSCCTGTCANDLCCPNVSCPSWATCGQVSNTCGNSATCGPGCSASQRCVSSGCFEDRTAGYVARTDGASNNLVLLAGSTYPMEVRGSFVSSRGIYADAMTFAPLAPNASCNIDGSRGGCPQYTLECANCPPDPNAAPGELSCWCNSGARLEFADIPPRGDQPFSSELFIDMNRDRKSDQRRGNGQGAGNPNASPVRYYPILANGTQSGSAAESLVRFEWEDDRKPPDGDFNDYVGALAVKDCDGTRFPPSLASWPELGLVCGDACQSLTCAPDEAKPKDLRIHAAVGADYEKFEGDREPRGRMVTVSVAIYGDPVSTQRMAVCPVAWFGIPAGTYTCGGSNPPDELQRHDVGASGACMWSGNADISCTPNGYDCKLFPVALAAEQHYGPLACKTPMPRTGPSDAFELPPPTNCGATATVLDFQLQEALVDQALKAGPSMGLLTRSAEQILGISGVPEFALQRIDVYVIDKLMSPDFRCPSGVNVDFGAVDPSLGRVRKYVMGNEKLSAGKPGSFSVYVRK